jgi:hypothetical protein
LEKLSLPGHNRWKKEGGWIWRGKPQKVLTVLITYVFLQMEMKNVHMIPVYIFKPYIIKNAEIFISVNVRELNIHLKP